MKTGKRILSVLLSVLLLLGTVAFGGTVALAEETYSVGDTLEYGTYPQSGVTDEATVAALNEELTDDGWVSYGYYSGTNTWDDGQMQPGDWMKYQDVVYEGAKYRAVLFEHYRPYFTGNSYWPANSNQDENGYETETTYWFKFEPIEWKVLNPADGFIVCNSAIDSQSYNNYILSADGEYWGNAEKTYRANDYANSSIRAWLNNDFINTAFSSSQQENIKVTELDNSCPYDSNYDSANTSDKILLLSYNEAINSDYGFNSSAIAEDTARQRSSSDYAKSQGIRENSAGNSYWWLRSPYNSSHRACDVNSDSYANSSNGVSCTGYGVVPALKLQNLKSDPTGADVSAEETYSVGDTLQYGTYPQSGVTDEATVAALNEELTDDGWISYGYYSGTGTWDDGQMQPGDWMRYQDAVLDGVKYRAVTFDSFRPHSSGFTSSSNKQKANGYSTGKTYWFKFEPIEWKVLDPDSGLIVCNSFIDSQAYNNYILNSDGEYWGNAEKTYRASDYANSSIRAWLNNDFINTAFSSSQQENIKVTELDNSCPSNSNYGSATTFDKIFLLSYNEVTNSAYGFNPDAGSSDTARQRTSSDYAKCQGIFKDSAGNSYWWLRSPDRLSSRARGVYFSGCAEYNFRVNDTDEGVVPALELRNLESDPTGVPVTVEPEIPLLRINEETYFWEVSYDNGATWESLGVKATGENGADGVTPKLRINEETNYWEVSYDGGTTWTSLGVKATGENGQNGADGQDGADGEDGITPQLKIGDDNYWYVSYDNGVTWECLNIKATGEKGENGKDGQDGQNGSDGKMPLLRINPETNEWEVSYDEGVTWTSLGIKATGENGADGRDGQNGQNGTDGKGGLNGADGKDGENGKDAPAITGMRYNENGELIITMSDGTEINAGKPASSENQAEKTPSVSITGYQASRSVDYGATITFHAKADSAPDGYEIHFFLNGEDQGASDTLTVNATNDFTVCAKLVKDGSTIAESEEEEVNVKSDFFSRIVAFFKKLFNSQAFIIDQN